jgi:hypothetical protein
MSEIILNIVLATFAWTILWVWVKMTEPFQPRTKLVPSLEFQPEAYRNSDPEPEMKSDISGVELQKPDTGAIILPTPANTQITEEQVQKLESDHLFYQEQIGQFRKKFQNLSSIMEGFEEMDKENRLLKENASTWVTTESELRQEVFDLTAEIKRKDQQLESKMSELEVMKAEVDSIQTTLEKDFLAKLDYYVDHVRPRILQLETEKSLLESTVDDLRKSCSRKRIEELEEQNTRLRESCEAAEKSKEKAEKSKEKAEYQVAELSFCLRYKRRYHDFG